MRNILENPNIVLNLKIKRLQSKARAWEGERQCRLEISAGERAGAWGPSFQQLPLALLRKAAFKDNGWKTGILLLWKEKLEALALMCKAPIASRYQQVRCVWCSWSFQEREVVIEGEKRLRLGSLAWGIEGNPRQAEEDLRGGFPQTLSQRGDSDKEKEVRVFPFVKDRLINKYYNSVKPFVSLFHFHGKTFTCSNVLFPSHSKIEGIQSQSRLIQGGSGFSHSIFSIFSPSLANLSKQLVKRIVADSSSSCRYLGVRSQPACKGLRSLGQGAAPAGWWRQSLWCRERRMARGKLVGLKSSHWDVNWGWDVGGQLLVGQGEWLASGYNYILHKELLVELTQGSWVGSG